MGNGVSISKACPLPSFDWSYMHVDNCRQILKMHQFVRMVLILKPFQIVFREDMSIYVMIE